MYGLKRHSASNTEISYGCGIPSWAWVKLQTRSIAFFHGKHQGHPMFSFVTFMASDRLYLKQIRVSMRKTPGQYGLQLSDLCVPSPLCAFQGMVKPWVYFDQHHVVICLTAGVPKAIRKMEVSRVARITGCVRAEECSSSDTMITHGHTHAKLYMGAKTYTIYRSPQC